jgi:hypothetical protein
VWTPRRVLLLILGLVLFGAAFGVYARFLGWIDGLPELPDELLTRRAEGDPIVEPLFSPVEAKLQLSFGPGCIELGYSYKIEMRAKGMVLAFNDFGIDPEGRVKLWPFSLATFKERPGQYPEINVIHSDVANLEFERPVKALSEIGERRIVGCQLESDPNVMSHDPRKGRIIVINNRATATPDDDLVLETPGPVLYHEAAQPNLPLDKALPQIKTSAAVQMVDRRHQPESTTIDAQGMLVFLSTDPPEPAGAPRKQKAKGSAVTGVRRIILPSNVHMSLWTAPGDGFLATGPKSTAAAPPGPPKPDERNHVLIDTPGKFTYDVLPDGDLARFDRLPPSATPLPNCVRVVRPISRGSDVVLNDQLECDTLELKFAQKTIAEPTKPGTAILAPPKPPAGKEDDRQSITWAHAWGQFIVLTSDSDKLEAHGNDLFYDARTKGSTLKGVPEMVAVKDGHEIHAPEMTMFGAEAQQGRHAEAHGKGYFRLVDRAGTKRTVDARWRDLMTYRQDEGHDLVTLTGEAEFEDRENHQQLDADLLKLWMVPEPKPAPGSQPAAPPATAKPKAATDDDAPKFHPQRLEATGHVVLRTPDLTGHDIDQLVLLFKEAPPAPPQTNPQTNPKDGSPWATPLGPTAELIGPPAPSATVAGQPPGPPPAKKPIDLAARTVLADIIRRGDVNEIDTVYCEDNVRVHQDPVPPQERPVDMRGTALKLKHTIDGDILTVTGTLERPGEVHLPDLSLIGPHVVIDQKENVAEVEGVGSMRMISTSDFDGKKLAKPTPLIVTWKQGMRFTGKQAVFRGFVQADQENTTVLCQTMQVDLNRPVSLRQQAGAARTGTPGQEPAKVDKVICDAGPDRPQGVIITDTVRENGRLVSSKQIEADEVAIHNEEGWMDAANHGTGRGKVRIVQLGPKGEPGVGPPQTSPSKRPPAAGKQPPQPAEQEFKATLIRYNGTMKANNQTRTARFTDGVEMLHMPVDTPEQPIPFDATVNKLPVGTLYLRSMQMTVYSVKDANGQTRQEMIATGRANVTWGMQFYGAADEIKFDEAKQQLTLVSSGGGLARARKFSDGGGSREVIGKKIIYNRSTDTVTVDGGISATIPSGH